MHYRWKAIQDQRIPRYDIMRMNTAKGKQYEYVAFWFLKPKGHKFLLYILPIYKRIYGA